MIIVHGQTLLLVVLLISKTSLNRTYQPSMEEHVGTDYIDDLLALAVVGVVAVVVAVVVE
jgi:hypothetical protein